MARETTTLTAPIPGPSTLDETRRRTLKPVNGWALFGCVWLALVAYSVTRWLLGGHAHPVSSGGHHPDAYMVIAARVWEALGLLPLPLAVYYGIYRPWRREGHRRSLTHAR